MFSSLTPSLLTLLLSLGPADIATGTLQIERHGDTSNDFAERCHGVLLARDTVLVRASCFERNLNEGRVDLENLDARFQLDLPSPREENAGRTVTAVDLHPDFQAVDCKAPEQKLVCEAARQYCLQELEGPPRMRCLARPEFFARTKLAGKNVDLALVYLNGFFESAASAIAQHADLRPSSQHVIRVVQLDGLQSSQQLLSATPYNVRLAFTQAMLAAPVAFAFVTSSTHQNAVFALPSRLAELVRGRPQELMLEYSRIDTAEIISWLTSQMERAVQTGRRFDTAPLQFVDMSAPAETDPVPAPPSPPPEPSPIPVPQPVPPLAPNPTPPDPQTGKDAPSTPAPNEALHGQPAELDVPRWFDVVAAKGGCGGSGLEEWAVLFFLPMFRRKRKHKAQ